MCSIWERWEGEEESAYAAFRYYLEQTAPRRINSLYLVQTVALPTLYTWASRYQWARRSEAFDAHFRHLRDSHFEALLKEDAVKIAEKHAEFLGDLREIVGVELAKQLSQIKSTPRSMLSFSEIVRAGDIVIKADRLIRDLATDVVQVDMGEASLEQLKALREQALRVIKGE